VRLDPLTEAAAAEVAAGRRSANFWAWLRKWRRRLKLITEIGGLVALMFGAAAKAWLLLKARDVGRAELPIGGSERMAVDRGGDPPKLSTTKD
jgi:ribose/xylose/arabinose/galactoside ABC-type transport system permease subunit